MLHDIPQAAIIIGRDQTIEWCNEGAVDVLAVHSASDVVGRHLSQVSKPFSVGDGSSDRWDGVWQGRAWVGEVETFRHGQPIGHLRVCRSPLRDETGEVVAVLGLATDPTEELRARSAITRSRDRLRALLEYSGEVAVVVSPRGRITYVSPAAERITGWEPSELLGARAADFVHPGDRRSLVQITRALIAGEAITSELRLRRSDGSYGWFEHTLGDLVHVPSVGGVVGTVRDVTARHLAEEARRESELILHHVVDQMSDAFLGVDESGLLTAWNPAAEQIFGWSSAEALGRELVDLVIPESDREIFRRVFAKVLEGSSQQFLDRPFEMLGLHQDGRSIPVEVSVVELNIRGGTRFAAFVRDIAERKAAEARLAHQALSDSLTGLPNRTLLHDRLGRTLARASRHGGTSAVLFLDVDRFKVVNDALGHSAGDELLVKLAGRLRNTVRETDTVARYGGDEFVVVAEKAGSLDEVRALAGRLLDSASAPIVVAGRVFRPRVSIGIAVTDDPSIGADDLVRQADIAMYRAKEQGGNRVELFEAEMESRAIVRFELERDLARAVEASLGSDARAGATAGKLCVYYQPIVTFDGRVNAVEALVRWDHPTRGLIPPLDFIPVAEETGLIIGLGTFVLEEAARQLARWRDAGRENLSVSVNVSARQLDDSALPRVVERVIAETGIDPASLCLELTESALLRDSADAGRTLAKLDRLGVKLIIDDFGTGYSSLAYLQRFPIQAIKLDRSFVSGVPESPQDAAVVEAVINLAHALGIEAIAEGIETDEQREALAELGCEFAQGFLWSPPRPARELSSVIGDAENILVG